MVLSTYGGEMMLKQSVLTIAAATLIFGQSKPVATLTDYGKWETLGPAVLSPDGQWLSHQIRRSDGTYELRVSGIKTHVAAFGTDAAFSADSRWVAYAVGVSDTEEDKLKKAKKPVQKKLGVLDLKSGAATTV